MKYMEIKALIQADLKKYVANQLIPSERFLAMKYQCSRETIRKAYEQLRAEDKIYKVHQVGWFVSNQKIQYDPNSIENFNRYVAAQGFQARTELISAQLCSHDFAGRAYFDAQTAQAGFVEIIRRRYVDDVAVLLEYNYLPLSLFPDILSHDIIPSVEEVVKNKFNVPYTTSHLKIKNTAADGLAAEHLGIPPNQTALRIERVCKSFDQVIEFDIEIWCEDKIEMCLEVIATV